MSTTTTVIKLKLLLPVSAFEKLLTKCYESGKSSNGNRNGNRNGNGNGSGNGSGNGNGKGTATAMRMRRARA